MAHVKTTAFLLFSLIFGVSLSLAGVQTKSLRLADNAGMPMMPSQPAPKKQDQGSQSQAQQEQSMQQAPSGSSSTQSEEAAPSMESQPAPSSGPGISDVNGNLKMNPPPAMGQNSSEEEEVVASPPPAQNFQRAPDGSDIKPKQ